MPRRRSTQMGKVSVPKEIRTEKDVPAFESMLSQGPLTIVLVFADWCGHCTNFKNRMWNEVSAMPNKSVNTAAVHYDMLDKTSLKNAKIEGYPSLLLVGTDKKPADFKDESGSPTNAMPQPQTIEQLKTIVTTPVNQPVRNANTVAPTVATNTVANNTAANNVNIGSLRNNNTVGNNTVANNVNIGSLRNNNLNTASLRNNNTVANNTTGVKNTNSFAPAEPTNLENPPDLEEDIVSASSNKTVMKGGSESLLSALLRITGESAHAGILLGAAALAVKKTRKAKRSSKKAKKQSRRR
jgi:thiol-disulfide isomerase/thioredoxin